MIEKHLTLLPFDSAFDVQYMHLAKEKWAAYASKAGSDADLIGYPLVSVIGGLGPVPAVGTHSMQCGSRRSRLSPTSAIDCISWKIIFKSHTELFLFMLGKNKSYVTKHKIVATMSV